MPVERTPQTHLPHNRLHYEANPFYQRDSFASFVDSPSSPFPSRQSNRHRRLRRPVNTTQASVEHMRMYSLARSQQLRLAESAEKNRGLLNLSVFLQQYLSSTFPLQFHDQVVFAAHHIKNPHPRTPNYAVRFYAPFNRLVDALPIYFNDTPINIDEDMTDCYEIVNELVTIPYLYGHQDDVEEAVEANRDALPCGRDLVTNTPDLTIDPDDNDDDLELYGAPVRPPVKPRFIDVARLANAWCQHYPETAQRGNNDRPQNVVETEDDGHQDLAYPSPPPLYECFDPIFYPTPWDNDPILMHLREKPPRGRHEETIVEPQNEAGPSSRTDEAAVTSEARGNSPPWRHLPGGFYEWYRRPGRYEEDERPEHAIITFDEESERGRSEDDREETLEQGNNEDDDTDYLVTRTRRYKRPS
jgi:hypothetical protein